MAISTADFTIDIVPGPSIPTQKWWPAVHKIINEAYDFKSSPSVFPSTWNRLDVDPVKGGKGLAEELGNQGHLAVVFNSDGHPMACGGVLPFRGEAWITEAFKKTDAELANTRPDTIAASDWETCCWCVHSSARGQRLSRRLLEAFRPFLKAMGATRLYSNYVVEETGEFWPKLGFVVVPGGGGILPKGFTKGDGLEGLRADVYFGMGVLEL